MARVRQGDAAISGSADPGVGLVYVAHTAGAVFDELRRNLGAVIGGTVVHDDEVPGRMRLSQY